LAALPNLSLLRFILKGGNPREFFKLKMKAFSLQINLSAPEK